MEEVSLIEGRDDVNNILRANEASYVDWKYQADIISHRNKVSKSNGSISWMIIGYDNNESTGALSLQPLTTPKVIASGSGGLKAFVEVDGENEVTKHMKQYGYLYWIYARINIKDKSKVDKGKILPFDLRGLNLGSEKLLLLNYRHEDEKLYAQFSSEEKVKMSEIKYLMALKSQLHGHIIRKLFNHHVLLQAFPKFKLFHKNLYPRIMQSLTVDHEESNLILVLKIKYTAPMKKKSGVFDENEDEESTTILPLVKYMKSSTTVLEVKKRIVKSMNNRGLKWTEKDLKLVTISKRSNESILRTFTMDTKVSIREKAKKGIDLYESTILIDDHKTLGELGISSGNEIFVERTVEKHIEDKGHSMFSGNKMNKMRIGRSMLLKSKLVSNQGREVNFMKSVRNLEKRDIDKFTSKSKRVRKEHKKKKNARRLSAIRKKKLVSICRELGANFIETSDLVITKRKPLGVGRTARVFEGLLRCHVTEDNIKEGLAVFQAPEGEKMIIKTNKKGQLVTSILQNFAPKLPLPNKHGTHRERSLSYASVGEVLTLEPLEVAIKVAIKQFTCRHVTETVGKAFQQEIQALCQIDHVGVVRCLGIYVDEVEQIDSEENKLQLLIVYELCARGDMRDLKNESVWASVPFVRRYAMILPAVEAFVFMQEQGMVHRDLKIDNILVSENFTFKIGDFGVAKLLNPDLKLLGLSDRVGESSAKGTLGYTAPEVASGESSGTIESDVFSFGVVLYNLVCDYMIEGKVHRNVNPFLTNVDEYEEQFIDNAHLDKLVFSPETPDSLKNLIKDCLRTNPSERCSSKEILSVFTSLLS